MTIFLLETCLSRSFTDSLHQHCHEMICRLKASIRSLGADSACAEHGLVLRSGGDTLLEERDVSLFKEVGKIRKKVCF